MKQIKVIRNNPGVGQDSIFGLIGKTFSVSNIVRDDDNKNKILGVQINSPEFGGTIFLNVGEYEFLSH